MKADQHTLTHSNVPHKKLVDYIAPAGLALAASAALSAAISGLGTRWGWWHFTTGFTILRLSAVAGLVATLVSLTGGILSGWKIRRASRNRHRPGRTSGGGRCCGHTLVVDADRSTGAPDP